MLLLPKAGSFYITKPSVQRGKELYSWAATDAKAVVCLRALLPFLRIKRDQAMNCLALRDIKTRSMKAKVACDRGHTGAARRPIELTLEMEAAYLRAKELNRAGV